MTAGLADQVEHLRAKSDSFSLPAWRKWGRLMTDQRNAKAWPRVFADGHGLFGALLGIVEAVDANASPCGRPPAGPVRRRRSTRRPSRWTEPALTDAAQAWRRAAEPGTSSRTRRSRRTSTARDDAVEAVETLRSAVDDGEAGRARVRAAAETAWAIRARYADAFPLPPDRVDEILRGSRRAARRDLRGRGRRRGGHGRAIAR